MKTYLTVNTVVYNHELIQMRKVIDKANEHGVSAIIAADQSVLQYCNSVGAPVHLSTQLNISNIETLKFYAKFADVAVLARELELVERVTHQRIEEGDTRRTDDGDKQTVEVPAPEAARGEYGDVVVERRILRQECEFHQFRRWFETGQDHPKEGHDHDDRSE